jgi:hypothetical protein
MYAFWDILLEFEHVMPMSILHGNVRTKNFDEVALNVPGEALYHLP